MQTQLYETRQRAKYSHPTKYCGIITASHFSAQQVFNLFDSAQMRPSFNVYMDVGLGELEMTVEASKQKPVEKKKKSAKPFKQSFQRTREISGGG